MIYANFDGADEKAIQKFITKHRGRLSSDSMRIDPNGKVIFLFEEVYNAKAVSQINMRIGWQAEVEKLSKLLGDNLYKIALYKQMETDAVVGERDLSGAIGGLKGVESISAERAIRMLTEANVEYERNIKTLQELIDQE